MTFALWFVSMDPADLRAFARRDRTAASQLEREHWARELREHGGLATLRAGHASTKMPAAFVRTSRQRATGTTIWPTTSR